MEFSSAKDSAESPEARRVRIHGVTVEVKSDVGDGYVGIQPTPEEWAQMNANRERTRSTHAIRSHLTSIITQR